MPLAPVQESQRTDPVVVHAHGRCDPHERSRLGYWCVNASHTIVDLYPTFVLALSVQLQHDLNLTQGQVQAIFSLNPIISGLSQPVLAWLSDRLNSSLLAPIGLAVGAVCLSSIGHADSFLQLIALQVMGMAGTGVYHPISAALAGRTGKDIFKGSARRSSRAFALSIFFAFGMLGGFMGPISATRINETLGIDRLWLMAIPGVVAACLLWWGTRGVAHRDGSAKLDKAAERAERAARFSGSTWTETQRWRAVLVLFASNSLLFITNIGLYYLYKRWCELRVEGSPAFVSARVGDLIASSQLGMAVGGLALGYFIRPGRERTALFFASFLSIPVILLMPHLEFRGMLGAAFLSSLGYFSVIPAFIALGQRMLPHATGMVGSLLMGCGWAVSSCAPRFGGAMIDAWGLELAFAGFAVSMGLSWVVSLAIPRALIREAASAS